MNNPFAVQQAKHAAARLRAENLPSDDVRITRAYRLALGRPDPGRRGFGLGLYVDFAATEQDWAAYRAGWGAV